MEELQMDPPAETVALRYRQSTVELGEQSAEEWMLDYALKMTVEKLVPARKRKVRLLVEAFETVLPDGEWFDEGRTFVTRIQRLPSIGSLFPPLSFTSSPIVRTPLLDYHSLRQQFSSDHSSSHTSGDQISHTSITIDQISPHQTVMAALDEILEDNEQEPQGHDPIRDASNEVTIPSVDTISREAKDVYLKICVPLYQAALEGNWNIAKCVIDKYPQAIRARITRGRETVLHIAAAARHTKFLEELVKLMTPEDLELENNDGNTALCFAVASGTAKIAKLMVKRNKNLPNIRNGKGVTPLYMAALLGHKEMVWYLYSVTRQNGLRKNDHIGLLFASIGSNLYDMALHILELDKSMARARNVNGETALHVLARKPSAFEGGIQLGFWRRCIHSGIKVIQRNTSMHSKAHQLLKCLWEEVLSYNDSDISKLITKPESLLFVAVELGNVEFLNVLIRSYPDLIWTVDTHNRSIFHVAVAYRQEKIFNLIYKIGGIKDLIAYYRDENGNNMLHMAGKLASQSQLSKISGAALQMQQELIWFKEVENIVQPSYVEMENSDGKIPRVLFTEQHKFLLKDGEQWMKDTATSCMVVATLIATVMFAAAFTVPGGNNGDTGIPIFLKERSFLVFTISDALSLFSSATSILMFLSILTSRYTERDFLVSLPIRLIIGLATLFISIATMMVAFSATFFIVLNHGLAWVAISVASLACIPVSLFALLHFPLFADMIRSTYKACFLFRLNKQTIKKHTWTSTSIPL